MKVFQILNDFCHHYHPEYETAVQAAARFHPSFLFVDAPDYVFEGWGYDETAEGDERFIKPTPPEGWIYDDATGTFYPEDSERNPENPSYDELLTMYAAIERGMTE